MKKMFIVFVVSLLLSGCATTPPTHKTNATVIEPINSDKTVIVETNGNVTRIYSINKEKK